MVFTNMASVWYSRNSKFDNICRGLYKMKIIGILLVLLLASIMTASAFTSEDFMLEEPHKFIYSDPDVYPSVSKGQVGGLMVIPRTEQLMEKVESCTIVKEVILNYMDRSDEYSRDNNKYETRANSLVLLYIDMGCDARSLALDIPRSTE